MIVERFKYVIWAADMDRAVQFYTTVFGGTLLKQNDIISEVSICDGIIGIHGGVGRRADGGDAGPEQPGQWELAGAK